jgi:predicted ATPase/DNA-binding SARP family transcriptional activator
MLIPAPFSRCRHIIRVARWLAVARRLHGVAASRNGAYHRFVARVRVGVLGSLVVAGADLPRARQQRVLLAALASAAPGAVDSDRLIEGLWPGDARTTARKALQVLVTRLRRALSPAGVDVVYVPEGYALNVDADEIDAVAFVGQVHAERALPPPALETRRRLLEDTLMLWRGEPFGDVRNEPLLRDAAELLHVLHDEAVARLHGVLLELGELDGLLPGLTAWARDHPLDEGAWCRLALGLYCAGRPTEALRALSNHRRVVRTTAGVEPTARLSELEAQILADEVPWHRAPRVGNLEVPVRSLLGRAFDIRRVREDLTPGTVTTLVGVGGVGKTVLALHACGGVAHRYRDGAWFCELADVATGDAVIDALASTLDVRQRRGATLLESVTGAFKDASSLVVLDNCEHVRAAAADVARALGRDCPAITIVATSREALGVRGEHVIPVEPLVVREEGSATADGDAYALFIERAHEAGATLGDDAEIRTAVTHVCHHLDGLPLAIELAAARARTMSIPEMAQRLDERFRLFTGGTPGAARRLQTLWDAVDWSYQLLTDDERTVFDQLAVFLGGFDVAAAATVVDRAPAELEPIVWSLAERSLVRLAPSTSPSRYHMLETLRQYGLERLAQTDRLRCARDRHRRHFVELARRTAPTLRGGHEANHVRVITTNLANLRAAHQHAIATGAADDAATLVVALHDYAQWRQFFELGSWARATLQLDHVPTAPRPALHAIAGWAACIGGDFHQAVSQAHLGLAAEAAGGVECGWLHDVLAHVAYFQGDNTEGLRHSQFEIDRARDSADPYRLSYVLADSGIHAALAGNHPLGRQRAAEALNIAEQLANSAVVSMAQLATAFTQRDHDPIGAIEWFQKAATLADTIDSSWTSSICRGELALLLALHGDPLDAANLIDDQLRAFRRAGDASRVRGAIREAIPSLYRLLGPDRGVDIVTLDAGTTRRPHVRVPFNDAAIAEVTSEIAEILDSAVFARAAQTAESLSDDDLAERTLELIREATATPPQR